MWPVSLAVNVNANPNYNSNSGTDCPAHNLHYLQAWFGELCFGISSTPHVFLCKGPFVQVLGLPVYLRLASAPRPGLRRHAGETYTLRERKHLHITGVPRPFRHGEAFQRGSADTVAGRGFPLSLLRPVQTTGYLPGLSLEGRRGKATTSSTPTELLTTALRQGVLRWCLVVQSACVLASALRRGARTT